MNDTFIPGPPTADPDGLSVPPPRPAPRLPRLDAESLRDMGNVRSWIQARLLIAELHVAEVLADEDGHEEVARVSGRYSALQLLGSAFADLAEVREAIERVAGLIADTESASAAEDPSTCGGRLARLGLEASLAVYRDVQATLVEVES